MTDLKRTATHGIAWNGIATVTKQVLGFAIGVIMARLLSPREFGLVGMTAVFVGFLNLFVEQGLGAAIIQRKDLNDSHLDSIFWLNVTLGLSLTLVLCLLSGVLARFYHEPILQPVTTLISFNFFIGSLGIVQTALIDKQVAFKKHAIVNLVSVVLSGAVGIGLAVKGYGVWSLAWQAVAATVSNVVVMWMVNSWRPSLRFSWAALRDVMGFSANLLGFNVMNYWMRNFDNLLIGRFLSSAALGIYSKAYQLMMLPTTQVSWVLARVMFPILSSIQDDHPKTRRIYLRSVQAIALVTFPLMTGLLVVSDSFVLAVFGPKWADLVPILRILCLAGMHDSVTTTVGWLYQSQGRTDLQFKLGIVEGVAIVIAFVIGLHWGLAGIAWAYVISIYLLWYPAWKIAGGLIGLGFGTQLLNIAGPTACSALMAGAVWSAGWALPAGTSHAMRLALLIPLGLAVYMGLIHMFKLKAYGDIREILANRRMRTD